MAIYRSQRCVMSQRSVSAGPHSLGLYVQPDGSLADRAFTMWRKMISGNAK